MSNIIDENTNDDIEEKLDIDEKLKQSIFSNIAGKELDTIQDEDDEFDASSSNSYVPFLFNGLETSSFGMSSNNKKNPFFLLKDVAIDKSKSWEDRTQAIKYMEKIPHIHRDINCVEAILKLIADEQYKFEDRYHFFSNNEKNIKLGYIMVNACHKYVYENFNKLNGKCKIPLIYRILSAQYALTQFPADTYDVLGVQIFLENIAKDVDMEINYRAECADILDRAGYGEFRTIGRKIIDELGDLYGENKKRTIYTNLQNVHDTTVTKRVINALRQIISSVTTDRNSGEIYEKIISLTEGDERRGAIVSAFQRILIDTARYEGLTMIDILLLVWEKICVSEQRVELEKRLLDELYEMDKTCSSGHLSRILNVLSGFFDDIQPVKISFIDQLRTNVFARYTTAMRTLGQHEQDAIVQEMANGSYNDKPTIIDFIESYSPREELKSEFVPTYMTQSEFDTVFDKSERDFFGIHINEKE